MNKVLLFIIALLGIVVFSGCNSGTNSDDVAKINNEIKAKQDHKEAPIPPEQAAGGATMAAPGMFKKGKN